VAASEKHIFLHSLNQHNWHRTRTAAALGISTRTLRRKIRKYQITPRS
jgi:DNA-binding NtrC family response regulator